MTHTIRTRFCPSPTGMIHLGNARTALFSYLLARAKSGHFLLRIEDTDRERSQEVFTHALKNDLIWLGLQWDEGPYFQSERQPIYDDYYERLIKVGKAYPCFCAEEELSLIRRIQRSSGKPPRYPGTCRSLTTDQIEEKLAQGLKPTLRFRVPEDEQVVFQDIVRGEQRFATNDMGDFIIRRADGTAPFLFCNAIDDALMEVTHVLRGEDHVANTPRQIMLLESLGLSIPTYGHMALIVGSDGSPLSKRHGSRSITELREAGYLSIALVNYMARLGHYYGHDELLDLQGLASQFNMESFSRAPAKYDTHQLDYWQKTAVTQLNSTQFWEWVDSALLEKVPSEHVDLLVSAVQPNVLFPSDVANWIDILFNSDWSASEEVKSVLKLVDRAYFKVALESFEKTGKNSEAMIAALKTTLSLKGKALFQPLRLALTGLTEGPELAKIMELLSSDKIRERLDYAANL